MVTFYYITNNINSNTDTNNFILLSLSLSIFLLLTFFVWAYFYASIYKFITQLLNKHNEVIFLKQVRICW